MSLSPAQIAEFTEIIDKIIANGDVDTITVKHVRNGLQSTVGQDLTEHKGAIKILIHERFDNIYTTPETDPAKTNGHSSPKVKKERPTSSSTPLSNAEEDDDEASSPPRKKLKNKSGGVDSDSKLAAKLQAQENARTRSTRGGGAKVVKKRATAPKRKSKQKVGTDDDSDIIGSDGEKKEVVRKGGFHKEYMLSEPLAALVGETQLSRPQVVKKIWAHIKAHELQDPGDKRQIRCDDKMTLVFKTDKVHMFTMNKLLGNHLYPLEES